VAGQRWGNGGPYVGQPGPGYQQQPPGQWVPPPSPPRRQGPSGPLIAVLLTGVVLLVAGGIAAAILVSSGNGRTSTQTSTVRAPAPVVTQAAPTPTVTQTVQAPSPPVSSPPTAGRTSCGGNLSVGPNTSCAFAANVQSAYESAGGGNTTVSVYSPATGRTYDMSCGPSGGVVVCTGGQGASVYFPQ
jgi:hypothetical protein